MIFDMFVEGDRPKEDGRQYVTLTDFPVPVVLDKNIYLKRVRLVIDVTEHGLSPTADQSEFQTWLDEDEDRMQALMVATLAVASDVARDPSVRQEAKDFMQAMGRTIQ